MENVKKAPDAIRTWRIICAAQSEPDYSEDRQILIYAGDGTWDDEYMVLDGGHCSCYDWDDVEFDAVKYTSDELDKLSAFASRSDSIMLRESE